MIAVSTKPAGIRADGKKIVDALIVASTTPDALPTNGANVEHMNADEVFAPFSVLYVVDQSAATKVYIANESGLFIAQ